MNTPRSDQLVPAWYLCKMAQTLEIPVPTHTQSCTEADRNSCMDIHIADPSVDWETDDLISWSASKPLWGTTILFIDEQKIAQPQEDPEPHKA